MADVESVACDNNFADLKKNLKLEKASKYLIIFREKII
jgi:hypothetical protein